MPWIPPPTRSSPGAKAERSSSYLFSTDKGLCGALDANLFRGGALAFHPEKTVSVSVGRKGTQFLARTQRKMLADFPLHDRPNFLQSKQVFQVLHREASRGAR